LSRWKVTVRTGPKVEREKAETLAEALDAVELHARAAANTERRAPVDTRVRRYEPGDQVAVRAELRGPGVNAGLDVRGDGSVDAWTGRIRRRSLTPEDGETPYEALRRAVQSTAWTRSGAASASARASRARGARAPARTAASGP
jgi:hypothetical protein